MRILLCLLLSLSFLQAQTIDLISIPLNDQTNRSALEALELPLYFQTETAIIVPITPEKATLLGDAGITYRVLDRNVNPADFYLVSPRKGIPAASIALARPVLATNGGSFLVRARTIGELGLDQTKARAIRVPCNIRTYRDEKIILTLSTAGVADSVIQSVTAEIKQDSVRWFLQSLENFGTRYSYASNHDQVAKWIQSQFLRMGLTDVRLDSFYMQDTWHKNVIATVRGSADPDQLIVVGGHHDSITGSAMFDAPGADDNASGTAAVLEVARAIMRKEFKPKSTLVFATYAAEEQGLWGSQNHADRLRAANTIVGLMINHDMIAQSASPLTGAPVNINYYKGWEPMQNKTIAITKKFTVLNALSGGANSAGSDSWSYWTRGYPAVYFEEFNFSPYYHTTQDLVAHCRIDYCTEVIKASCAMAMTATDLPAAVSNMTLVDAGNGSSLIVRWKKSTNPDIASYRVYIGKASGVYDTNFTMTDTVYRASGLTAGTRYYIGVASAYADGATSFLVERSAIPNIKPLTPTGFAVNAQWHGVQIKWSPNGEYDLLGYNVYRASTAQGSAEKLNLSVLRDTLFIDSTGSWSALYYYSIAAVDSLLNESIRTSPLGVRAVSLSKTLGIIDATRGSDGTPMNPTDEQINSYYASIIPTNLASAFPLEVTNVDSANTITLSDLGAYRTVIIHANAITNLISITAGREALRRYLQFGGKVLITTYRPSTVFANNTSYPKLFAPGDFIYDFLKVAQVNYRNFTYFNGAISAASGYPSLAIDTTKTILDFDYQLYSIEAITPTSAATILYTYDSRSDTTLLAGKMKGMPVGIKYNGSDFKVVLLSFPLYYTDINAAKAFMAQALVGDFQMPVHVSPTSSTIPDQYSLDQNYPNPFNPATTISFHVASAGPVQMKVYNVLGKEVSTVINDHLDAGKYQVSWNGVGFPSGVYYCRMTAGSFSKTIRVMLLK